MCDRLEIITPNIDGIIKNTKLKFNVAIKQTQQRKKVKLKTWVNFLYNEDLYRD